jgi:hypothetical protein
MAFHDGLLHIFISMVVFILKKKNDFKIMEKVFFLELWHRSYFSCGSSYKKHLNLYVLKIKNLFYSTLFFYKVKPRS